MIGTCPVREVEEAIMMKIECRTLRSLTDEQKQECIELANAVCPAQDQTAYLQNRLHTYEAILTARDRHGLAAFQLMQRFTKDEQHYLYLGPLYSRRKAYLPLFLSSFEGWMRTYRKDPFHVMAEIQNPDILLVFKALFLHTAYPQLHTVDIPLRVQQTARIFAEELNHISHLEPSKLSTRSNQTLYLPKPGKDAVLEWLRARNVHLEQGDSQILLLTVPRSYLGRQKIRADLLRGKLMLKQWHRFYPLMLRKFKEGIPV
jgi:hypothetical protein